MQSCLLEKETLIEQMHLCSRGKGARCHADGDGSLQKLGCSYLWGVCANLKQQGGEPWDRNVCSREYDYETVQQKP